MRVFLWQGWIVGLIGTALGIYGIWALTRPETEALFARRRYQPAA